MMRAVADPDEQRTQQARLDQLFSPHAMASVAQMIAKERERQDAYDAMALSDLREAAMTSLTAAAATIRNTKLMAKMRHNGWTKDEADRLGDYFLKLVDNIDNTGPNSQTNMAKWFDFSEITFKADDELKSVAYGASEVYNAYVRRTWANGDPTHT
jgi:hypothetical protein